MLYEPNHKCYVICSVLNNCFFDKGKVLLAKHKTSRSLVAIKHFNLENFTHDEYESILNDIVYMRQLKHPNIVPYLTCYTLSYDLYVISPLMSYTSCRDLIAAHFRSGLCELLISFFLRDVLRALDYIHSVGFIHRAVKARHILIHADGRACLSGLRYMYPKSKCGDKVYNFPLHASHNLNWLSAEVLQQNSEGYDEKSDVYSVGVTACELANGVVPFAETSTTLMLTEKLRDVTPQLIDCTTWYMYDDNHKTNSEDVQNANDEHLSRKFSDSFHAFVDLCSQRNVSIRPSPKQLLNHSFFKQTRRRNASVAELLLPAVPFVETNTTELHEDVVFVEDTSFLHNDHSCEKEWDF